MLVLTRKPGQSLYIGDDIKITLQAIRGNQVRIGVDAPSHIRIYREEIYHQILQENKLAATSAPAGKDLEGLSRELNTRGGQASIKKVPAGGPTTENSDDEPESED